MPRGMRKKSKNRQQKKLKKIADRERDRLGSSSVVYTRAFSQRQTFGAASKVKRISPEEYQQIANREVDPG